MNVDRPVGRGLLFWPLVWLLLTAWWMLFVFGFWGLRTLTDVATPDVTLGRVVATVAAMSGVSVLLCVFAAVLSAADDERSRAGTVDW